MTILLKLILAHLVGDFGLQFKKWVDHKHEYGMRSVYLYVHVVIHALVTLLLLWPEISKDPLYLWIPTIILITHFMIDAVKLCCGRIPYSKAMNRILNMSRSSFLRISFFICW